MVCPAGRAFAQATRDPRAAWKTAGQEREPRLRALSYALLAPNPHNRQPWLAELVGSDTLLLTCQLDRRLPQTDPFDRQITIGLGGFIELLRVAAAADGWSLQIERFPNGDPGARLDERPFARVRFTRAKAQVDPLFKQVLQRRTNRAPYDMARPPTASELQEVVAAAGVDPKLIGMAIDPSSVARIRAVHWRGLVVEAQTHAAHGETLGLLRIGSAEVSSNPDGISLEGPMFEPMAPQADAVRKALQDPSSAPSKQMMGGQRGPVDATPAYIWLTTAANSRGDQLDAGRDWVRLNLASTAAGFGLQPQSAVLQEYPEMDHLLRQVHRVLAVDDGRVQMIGRIGRAAPSPPAPRWALSTRIRSA